MCVCTNVLILFILFDSDVLDEIIPTIFVWGIRSIEPQGASIHVFVLNHILI